MLGKDGFFEVENSITTKSKIISQHTTILLSKIDLIGHLIFLKSKLFRIQVRFIPSNVLNKQTKNAWELWNSFLFVNKINIQCKNWILEIECTQWYATFYEYDANSLLLKIERLWSFIEFNQTSRITSFIHKILLDKFM